MSDLLPSPTVQEQAPHNDLTGLVTKTEDEAFACGGFSDVFKGNLRCPSGVTTCVAIKVLRGRITEQKLIEKVRRRFNRESHFGHTLDHPNVLPCLGVSSGFGRFPAFITPFCANGNAVEYLDKHPEANRLYIVIGTAKGLEYLHSKDVIHGDMKGHNVVIDDEGNARISDFGRSLILNRRGFTTDLTGSASYMGPELFGSLPVPGMHGQNGVTDTDDLVPSLTRASDVYAFGMVALELLTGMAPWYYCLAAQVILRVGVGLRPDREKYNMTAISDVQWESLESCWVDEPEARPSMTEVIEFLESWQLSV